MDQVKISIFLLLLIQAARPSYQAVQLELKQLQENYPELATYLLNKTTTTPIASHTNSSTTTLPLTSPLVHLTKRIPKSTNPITTSLLRKLSSPIRPRNQTKSILTTTPPSLLHLLTTTKLVKTSSVIQTTKASSSSSSNESTVKPTITTPPLDTTTDFLYFNNVTQKFEGVSVQSTYSVVKTGNTTVTIITTSPEILPLTTEGLTTSSRKNSKKSSPLTTTVLTTESTATVEETTSPMPEKIKNFLPLYHQFIYTVKLSSQIRYKDNKSILELLNEQNVESSKLRVALLKTLSGQLGLNLTSLRLNWIEMVNQNRNSDTVQSTTAKSTTTSSFIDDDTYFQTDILNSVEAAYYYDSKEATNNTFIPKTSTTAATSLSQDDFSYVLVSLSSADLFDLQKSYLLHLKQHTNSSIRKLADIKTEFEEYCTSFFADLKQKHQQIVTSFKLNLVNLTAGFLETRPSRGDEAVKKVQYLQLCNLDQIFKIVLFNANQGKNAKLNKMELANSYLVNSTQELTFNQIEIENEDDDENDQEDDDLELDAPVRTESSIVNESKETQSSETKLIKLKSSVINENTENKVQEEQNETISLIKYYEQAKRLIVDNLSKARVWFWTVVPEEDFLLAVVVPLTIIVAMIILTIVVTCLLTMCNREYKALSSCKSSAAATNSNLTSMSGGTNTPSVNTSPKPIGNKSHSSHSGSLSKATNPIYKQRAYLSKGVPVILYEEMSDKPLEEYDENTEPVGTLNTRMGTGSMRSRGYYYRSPIIMRNEKPPMPAPPEYSKQLSATPSSSSSSYNTSGGNMNFLNEIKTLLITQDNRVGDASDESIQMLIGVRSNINDVPSSSSESPQPPIDSDDQAHLIHHRQHNISTFNQHQQQLKKLIP